jgi:uncharacterized protein
MLSCSGVLAGRQGKMAEIVRTLGNAILTASSAFKVVLLIGPRQVGKTTLLKSLQSSGRSYVSLDDLALRAAAQADPASFVDRLTLPVLIDEVQYAPNLFPYIKLKVDGGSENGLFWLTGSQQFELMSHVNESLAGRVAVLRLQGISYAEECGRAGTEPFFPTAERCRQVQGEDPLGVKALYEILWRGSFPAVVSGLAAIENPNLWELFYSSYVTTYIQQDIREQVKVQDAGVFLRFMQVAAARSGQLLNYADLARDAAISEGTAQAWLNALHASGCVYLLQPFHSNLTKRLVKTPKLYFMDTGLCSYLCGWLSPQVLERGAMAGAMLETWVLSEIIKSYIHNARVPRIFFYRDKEKREIDFLIEDSGMLHPIEVKKSASPSKSDASAFALLQKLKLPVGEGAVVCLVPQMISLGYGVEAVPLGVI